MSPERWKNVVGISKIGTCHKECETVTHPSITFIGICLARSRVVVVVVVVDRSIDRWRSSSR